MKRFGALALAALALGTLAACKSVSIDISHARTSAGYLNSALIDAGHLYLLDSTPTKEKVSKLAVLALTDGHTGATFASFKAKGVSGVSFSGKVDAGVKADVEADLTSNAFVELTNAQGVEYQGVYSDLTAAINKGVSNGTGIVDQWSLPDAAKADSPLRYLIVYGMQYADEATVGYNNSRVVDGSITLPSTQGGSVKVEVKGDTSEAFKGTHVPVLGKFYVLRLTVDTNDAGVPTYHFRQDTAFDMGRLPDILRKSQL